MNGKKPKPPFNDNTQSSLSAAGWSALLCASLKDRIELIFSSIWNVCSSLFIANSSTISNSVSENDWCSYLSGPLIIPKTSLYPCRWCGSNSFSEGFLLYKTSRKVGLSGNLSLTAWGPIDSYTRRGLVRDQFPADADRRKKNYGKLFDQYGDQITIWPPVEYAVGKYEKTVFGE